MALDAAMHNAQVDMEPMQMGHETVQILLSFAFQDLRTHQLRANRSVLGQRVSPIKMFITVQCALRQSAAL
jgi:hypothetical protein